MMVPVLLLPVCLGCALACEDDVALKCVVHAINQRRSLGGTFEFVYDRHIVGSPSQVSLSNQEFVPDRFRQRLTIDLANRRLHSDLQASGLNSFGAMQDLHTMTTFDGTSGLRWIPTWANPDDCPEPRVAIHRFSQQSPVLQSCCDGFLLPWLGVLGPDQLAAGGPAPLSNAKVVRSTPEEVVIETPQPHGRQLLHFSRRLAFNLTRLRTYRQLDNRSLLLQDCRVQYRWFRGELIPSSLTSVGASSGRIDKVAVRSVTWSDQPLPAAIELPKGFARPGMLLIDDARPEGPFLIADDLSLSPLRRR